MPKPNGLEGASLLPLLRRADAEWKRPAYTRVFHNRIEGRSARTERYRYTEWDGGKTAELYDHDNDSHEYRNLAGEPEHAKTVAEMKRRLRAGRN